MAARSHGHTRRLVRLRQQLDARPLHSRCSQGAPVAMAKLQPATVAASSCWNQCPVLLQPAGVCSTRSIPRRRKLHPAVKSAASNAVRYRELQPCTSELQPATGGAARGVAIFADAFFFLPNQFLVFAGTMYFFCWNRDNFVLRQLQSSQMLMLFFAGSIFYFASTDHQTLTRGEDFCCF